MQQRMLVAAKPPQNIPESEKNDEWYKRNVYYYLGVFNNEANAAQRRLMERNWRVYTGNMNAAEFNYLMYPEGQADPTLTVQAVFKNYQLAQPLIQSRINQFLSQKLSFSVDIINREAVLDKEERKAAIMAEKIAKGIMAQVSRETGVEIPVEEQSLGLPDDLKKIESMPIRELVEDTVLNGLHYLNDRYNYKEKFRKGLENMLVFNSILFRNRRINNDPVPEVINPIDTSLFMQTDDDQANWGDGFITVTWKSVADIMDTYELDDKQLDTISKLTRMTLADFQNQFWNNGKGWYSGYGWNNFYRNIGQENAKVLVAETQWRSQSEFYVKKSKNNYNDQDYYYKKISPEEYDQLEDHAKAKFRKVNYYDLRQCTLIGHDILVSKGRVKFQTRREDYGYGRVPLQLCGIQKNPLMAVMTILSPLQIEYSIAWFHIERLLGQAGGKMIELWLHNKPSGWSNEKWIFYAKNKGLNIREVKEGDELLPTPSMSQGVDLGMSSSLQYLIAYVQLIETTAQRLIGTNSAAVGALSGNEAVGVTQANLAQAQNMAVGVYYDVNRAIEQVLNDAVAKMKLWWKEGDVKVWQTDSERIAIDVTADMDNYDYGVFVQNNALDDQKMAKYEGLIAQLTASGGAEYFDILLEAMDAENSSEAKAIVKKGMDAIRKQNQAMQQQQLQVQQAGVQVQQQANQLKQIEIQAKAQTPVEVANITANKDIKITDMKLRHDENKQEIQANTENDQIAFQEGMDALKERNKKSGEE